MTEGEDIKAFPVYWNLNLSSKEYGMLVAAFRERFVSYNPFIQKVEGKNHSILWVVPNYVPTGLRRGVTCETILAGEPEATMKAFVEGWLAANESCKV